MPASYPFYYLRYRDDGRPFDVLDLVLANVPGLDSYTLELEWYNPGTDPVTMDASMTLDGADILAAANLGYTRTRIASPAPGSVIPAGGTLPVTFQYAVALRLWSSVVYGVTNVQPFGFLEATTRHWSVIGAPEHVVVPNLTAVNYAGRASFVQDAGAGFPGIASATVVAGGTGYLGSVKVRNDDINPRIITLTVEKAAGGTGVADPCYDFTWTAGGGVTVTAGTAGLTCTFNLAAGAEQTVTYLVEGNEPIEDALLAFRMTRSGSTAVSNRSYTHLLLTVTAPADGTTIDGYWSLDRGATAIAGGVGASRSAAQTNVYMWPWNDARHRMMQFLVDADFDRPVAGVDFYHGQVGAGGDPPEVRNGPFPTQGGIATRTWRQLTAPGGAAAAALTPTSADFGTGSTSYRLPASQWTTPDRLIALATTGTILVSGTDAAGWALPQYRHGVDGDNTQRMILSVIPIAPGTGTPSAASYGSRRQWSRVVHLMRELEIRRPWIEMTSPTLFDSPLGYPVTGSIVFTNTGNEGAFVSMEGGAPDEFGGTITPGGFLLNPVISENPTPSVSDYWRRHVYVPPGGTGSIPYRFTPPGAGISVTDEIRSYPFLYGNGWRYDGTALVDQVTGDLNTWGNPLAWGNHRPAPEWWFGGQFSVLPPPLSYESPPYVEPPPPVGGGGLFFDSMVMGRGIGT